MHMLQLFGERLRTDCVRCETQQVLHAVAGPTTQSALNFELYMDTLDRRDVGLLCYHSLHTTC